jgi:hypothetical protein
MVINIEKVIEINSIILTVTFVKLLAKFSGDKVLRGDDFIGCNGPDENIFCNSISDVRDEYSGAVADLPSIFEKLELRLSENEDEEHLKFLFKLV